MGADLTAIEAKLEKLNSSAQIKLIREGCR